MSQEQKQRTSRPEDRRCLRVGRPRLVFQKRGTFSCQYGLWPDRVESTEWSEEGVPGVEELRKQVQGHLDEMSPTG